MAAIYFCGGQGPKSLLRWWILGIYTYISNFIPIQQTVSELEGFKEKLALLAYVKKKEFERA